METGTRQNPQRLYEHTTDGGAQYLCSNAVPGTDEGSFNSNLIVRLDGPPEYSLSGSLLHAANMYPELVAALREALWAMHDVIGGGDLRGLPLKELETVLAKCGEE